MTKNITVLNFKIHSLILHLALMKKTGLVSLILIISIISNAQSNQIEVNAEINVPCKIIKRENVTFLKIQNRVMRNLIDTIIDIENSLANVLLVEDNVDRILAISKNGQKIIAYDKDFLASIKDLSKTDFWNKVWMITHQIGHLVSLDTSCVSCNEKLSEINADFFSGQMLYKLGLRQNQLSIINPTYISESELLSKQKRLTAIYTGFNSAKEDLLKRKSLQSLPVDEEEQNTVEHSKVNESDGDDRDLKDYDYVYLNGLKWMTKNLNLNIPDSWCYGTSNQSSYCDVYGRLYTYESAYQACDSVGWRLPTLKEWNDMIKKIVPKDDNFNEGASTYSTYAFKRLTEGGKVGLEIQMSGYKLYRWRASTYSEIMRHRPVFISTGFWTATQYDENYAYRYYLSSNNSLLLEGIENKKTGFSCRCVKE
ncbi:FISUMP domain-containing protein [Flavilitoribacter nigricans]|uniref:Fibrobacter succinogenes major paralogous domain-containing protein n=1 Tax=Flavilitoribacter nigricans (strain ATCC 23147 / DSM 23189 / NBRC 102662 / NCIMB 1420 / SS-2) TaxID=1122177 RepID=A0A2D0N7A2_FLAN2|nr:FISUMP domain-containing protein [Flavilitoribacter nigricans]PHN04347.1 hypothetical protein CRP01_22560 [Flavilitoribacter nigricans DSM 23189 = NBRC 102662]